MAAVSEAIVKYPIRKFTSIHLLILSYDHFGVLAELLPSGLPSMAVDLVSNIRHVCCPNCRDGEVTFKKERTVTITFKQGHSELYLLQLAATEKIWPKM